MLRILLISLLVVSCSGYLTAQPEKGKTDSLTWQLYQEKKWDKLLKQANTAFKRNIDFYYLRVRAGVAAYELKKYREAVSHFEKAYEEYNSDDFLNYFYYWSLVLSGREDEASGFADQLSPALLKQMQIHRKGWVSGVSAESLVSFNRNYNGLLDQGLDNKGGTSNFRSLFKSQFYKGLALDHHLLPKLNLYQNFSHIGIERTIQTNSKFSLADEQRKPATSQFQYFLNGRFLVGNGWSVISSASLLWGETYYYAADFQTVGKSQLSENLWQIRDYVINVGATKELTRFRTSLNAGYSEINQYRQIQSDLHMVYYPFGNVNLYIIAETSLHWDESDPGIEMIYHPQIGVKAGPVWLSGEYGMGKMKNFYTGGGMVVYNMPETVHNKWGFSLWVPLFRNRCNLTLRYLQSGKEGKIFVYSDAVNYTTGNYTFTDQSFLISLKWNL
jgi:hypothetical protein